MSTKKEYLFAGTSILCWGTVATISKLLMNNMDAMFALAFSFLFATVVLFFYNIKKKNFKKLSSISGKSILEMLLIGSLGILFYNLLFLLGTTYLPAQEAFVINYLWPAFIIIFSCIILREKMTLGKFAAIVFSFVGIIIATSNGNISNLLGGSIKGLVFSFLAAISYGLYCTLNKQKNFDKNISMFLAYLSGTIVAFTWVFISGTFRIPTGLELAGLMWNGIFCNALSFLTWAFALDIGNTAVIANLAYLTPFVSLFVTHFALGEEITIYSILGLILIVLGIIIQFLFKPKRS